MEVDMETWVFFLVGFAVVFLLLREFWLWYWKLNRIVELMEKLSQTSDAQKDLLIKLLATQKVALQEGSGTVRPSS
jgi:hypothetical protein